MGVAIKITGVPEQIVPVGCEVMLTPTTILFDCTVIIRLLEITTGEPDKQVAFASMIQVTESPFANDELV